MKQEISLVRLGAGVPEVWYEVNMCGEFSKESESGLNEASSYRTNSYCER